MDLVVAVVEGGGEGFQFVHRHPRAVGATAAHGAVAGRRRLDEALARRRLAQLVEDAPVGGDDEGVVGKFLRRLDDLAGGAHPVGDVDHRGGGLWMHQHAGIRIDPLDVFEPLELELLVDDAGAVPEQHVGAGPGPYVGTEVLVRRPEDLLAPGGQMLDDLQSHA